MTGGSSYLVKSMKDYDMGTSALVFRVIQGAPALLLLGSKTLNKVLTLAESPHPPL